MRKEATAAPFHSPSTGIAAMASTLGKKIQTRVRSLPRNFLRKAVPGKTPDIRWNLTNGSNVRSPETSAIDEHAGGSVSASNDEAAASIQTLLGSPCKIVIIYIDSAGKCPLLVTQIKLSLAREGSRASTSPSAVRNDPRWLKKKICLESKGHGQFLSQNRSGRSSRQINRPQQ